MKYLWLIFAPVLAFGQFTIPMATGIHSNGGAGTWTLVHDTFCSSVACPGNGSALSATCGLAGTPCVVTIPSTGVGNSTIIWVSVASSSQHTISAVNGCETFVLCGASCQAVGTVGGVDGAYILSNAGGKTSCSIVLSSASANYVAIWIAEYSHTNTASYDTAHANTDTSCSTCAAPALASFSGTNDVVTQVIIPINSCSAITTYTHPDAFDDGFGRAGNTGVASYSAPNWTCSTGVATVGAMALKQ